MGILSNYEPKSVFKFFEDICSIPHGSTNTKQISDYLVKFAEDRALKVRQDALNNVIIWKDGTNGYENSAPVILQGHMDMVAVKTEDCNKNMETEGLDLEVLDGDLIDAKGTSLGGDDGIAVAYALAILDSNDIAHPPIEAIFTVDEEIGMLGAADIDVSDLTGRIFMNMDSEDEGIFTVSCAGGATVTSVIPYETETINASTMQIALSGFTGGHSGTEINKGRLNANTTLGRILLAVSDDIRIISVNGGEKDNAIPTFATASVAVNDIAATTDKIEAVWNAIKAEYATVEQNICLNIKSADASEIKVMTNQSSNAVITALVNLPNGIQRMNPDMEDMVQTSLNLGILTTTDNTVRYSYAVRSSSATEKQFLIDKIGSLTKALNGTVEVFGAYPGWEYRPDSKLRDTMVKVYTEMYGQAPVVLGIHAGLECGIFASKLPGLDAISFGPQMQDIHTTNEVLSIASTKRTWELTVKTLAKLK